MWTVEAEAAPLPSEFYESDASHTRSTSHETRLQTEPNQQMNAGIC